MLKIAIAGAGFSGAIIARELAESGRYDITVFDERAHVAGNCHTERDQETGVMLHKYGPHIFHTSNAKVWEYIQKWDRFLPYTNRVKAISKGRAYSLPINLLTINQFFGKSMSPIEAKEFIGQLGDSSIEEARNFEEQGLKFLGRELYEAFFYGYTKKQWGVEPRTLPASILKRLPVRFNYDDNYYSSNFQGIPESGYTKIVERILDHPMISLRLKTRLDPENAQQDYDHVFYCGPLDGFFNYEEGRLGYRTLDFEKLTYNGDFQGNPVINYCDESIPFTRVTEHKHLAYWEHHEKTVCFREYSRNADPKDIPYYPIRLEGDKTLLKKYIHRAEALTNVTFVGRLATYRYLDMHQVIEEALETAVTFLNLGQNKMPTFSKQEI